MRQFKSIFIVTACMFAQFTISNSCSAEHWNLLKNGDGVRWVGACDTRPIGGSILAYVVQVREKDHELFAKVWVYRGVTSGAPTDRHYTNRSYLGEVVITPETQGNGTEKFKREAIKFKLRDLNFYITGLRSRNSEDRRLLCRVTSTTSSSLVDNCDEPPVEDILEEEPVDPGAEDPAVPDDPTYVP